jgi:transcriptional regulator GlxA family with amidase domain
LWAREEESLALAGPAKAAFDEFLLTLLLHHHPHNFSEDLAASEPTPIPGLVRRAERYMTDHADTPITVSDVAAHLGVSLRALQVGFQKWRNTTPNALLREIRLKFVRDRLLSDTETDVTTIAMRYGFAHLGRFSARYREKFGEVPSDTLRRQRSPNRRQRPRRGWID